MKRASVLLILLTVAFTFESAGQLVRYAGAKLALTSASQTFDYTFFQGTPMARKTGLNVALFVEWLDVPWFSAVSQIEYAQRGLGQEFVLTGPASPEPLGVKTFYSRLDYLSIPLFLKFRLPSPVVIPYLLVGPRLDILLSYRSDVAALNPIYDTFKKNAVGGSAGVGAEIRSLLPVVLLAEARYNLDFVDSYKTEFLKIRNNSFDFWLGVAL